MTEVDYSARLAKVQAAIDAILTGAASQVTMDDGTSVTRLDLDWLTREEARLVRMVRRQSRPRGSIRVASPR